MVKELRKNEQIRTREVLIIGENGEKVGVMPLFRAIAMAREQGLDLVEVAPQAVPPVCRLLDYGKYKYEQTKKEREARGHQRTSSLREIRIRPKIAVHDLEAKIKSAQRFLSQGDKVKVSLVFRGREITHLDAGKQLLIRVYDALKGQSVTEAPAAMEGHHMTVVLVPLPQAQQKKAAKAAKETTSEAPKAAPAEPPKATVAKEAKKETKESKEVVDAKA